MLRISNGVRWLSRLLALVGFAGLLGLALMTTVDIVMRFAFSHPLQGVNDISAMVMAVVIAACIPECLAQRQNISIEVLGDALGRWMKTLLRSFAAIVTFGFFAVMVWQFVPFAASSTASGEKTWVLQWPVGPWWWAVTGLLAAAVVVQLVVVIEELRALIPGLGGKRH